jgi:hypothetical protein
MYEGQSVGFGTKAEDQQYVNGTFKYWAKNGPTVNGTGSRLNDLLRHALKISDSLHRFVRMSVLMSWVVDRFTLAKS